MAESKAVIKLRSKYENELIKQYKDALNSVRNEMVKTAEKYSQGGVISKTDALLYARDKELIQNINNELSKLGETTLNLQKELQAELYKQGYFETIYSIDKQTGFEFSINSSNFAILNPETISKLIADQTFLSASKGLNNRVKNLIKTDIVQGIIQGKSIPDISKSVKISLGKATNNEVRIARTETHRAVESGSIDASNFADENGVKTSRQWVSTIDDKTRPDHIEMDGQIAEVVNGEAYFTFPDGTMTTGPGLSGVAAQDINCRCTTIDLIEDYTPANRRVGSEVETYKTFNEWQKNKLG